MAARPPVPAPPYDGGCLCGAVRYRLSARPLAVNACHCTDCKLIAPRDAFTHGGEVARYRKRAVSGREIDICRCAVCGTRLWHEPLSSPGLVFIAAGTLDDASWVVPASHIWIERASPGVVFQDDALIVEGQPATREMLMDAFTRLYGP